MKLLFVCNNMHIGGIQKSLLNLLKEISPKHDVTLFLFAPQGELIGELPPELKILSGNFATRILGLSQAEAKEKGLATYLWRSFWVVVTRLLGSRASYGPLARMQKLPGEYDAAISFMQNSADHWFYGGCNEFVHAGTRAARKISFVHCDFKNYFGNHAYNRGYYKHFDRIACVSDSVRDRFLTVCPEFKDRTYSVHNCYDFAAMEEGSHAYAPEYTEGVLNILSASRVSAEKGILRMIPIFARMKEKGLPFLWRIAGSGDQLDEAIRLSEEYGVSDRIRFLGSLANPYPYFARSDMLLVPSYDEAAPMVYGEAAYFHLPVFTTEVTSAHELVEEPGLGLVCKNTDEEIESLMERVLRDPSLLREKRNGAAMDNRRASEEFEVLIG